MHPAGHVYVTNGDVTRIACDAWLLPTARDFWVTAAFCHAVGLRREGPVPDAPYSWQGQGVLHLDHLNGPDRPDLWLGDVGRHSGSDLAHYARRAKEFIERASARVRTEQPNLDRAPLLALPVIGTGDGGQRSRRGDLLAELLPALYEAAEQHHCDLALVAYGSMMYAAAQSARRRLEANLQPWNALSPDLRETGVTLAALARSGDLVVFLGAGTGAAAGLPMWRPLVRNVAKRLGIDDDALASIEGLDPRDQATIIQRMNPAGFIDAVHAELTSERPALLHYLLAALPVREFVTTNFDTLFEVAACTADRQLAVLPGPAPSSAERWLLKLHGTIGSDLVLTRDDYLGASSRHV
ncbi:MAG: hypothetical protein RI958_782, partial [Actinomycetota bacterium]